MRLENKDLGGGCRAEGNESRNQRLVESARERSQMKKGSRPVGRDPESRRMESEQGISLRRQSPGQEHSSPLQVQTPWPACRRYPHR